MGRDRRLDKRYLWHPFTQQAEWEKEDLVVVASAKGRHLTDDRGRRYLDGVSSLWVNVHGHRVPAIDRAVRRQLSRVAHTTFLGLTHAPAARLGRELVRLAPKGLSRVFYSDNGATAVEVALKMAFQYWANRSGGKATRTRFAALEGSYHGDTLGAVSVGGIASFHRAFKPLLFKADFAMSPHCYRCPYNRAPKDGADGSRLNPPFLGRATKPPKPGDARPETGCRWQCLSSVADVFRKRGERLAGMVVEPAVQGAAGMRVMPTGYLKGVERLCRRYGILLIADEVATGFGRTGPMFAVEREGVRPDFLCLAKSITGGYLPLAATLAKEEVYRAFLGRYDEFKAFFHGHSYTANPLACAAALANLRLFRERPVLRAARRRAEELARWLGRIRSHPNVGDVRQAGLMAGVELVSDKRTGRPFPPARRIGRRVCLAARRRGVWLRPLGDVLVILPPLGITAGELRRLLRAAEAGLRETLPAGAARP
jgi:adenosylmethionine-8-amino-7-oxononanoate aminotransferase